MKSIKVVSDQGSGWLRVVDKETGEELECIKEIRMVTEPMRRPFVEVTLKCPLTEVILNADWESYLDSI
jgi:hypothetical protein